MVAEMTARSFRKASSAPGPRADGVAELASGLGQRSPSSIEVASATTMHIKVTVNGEVREADVEPRLLLVHLLRDSGLTGAHRLRHEQLRGVHVHVNGESAKSCTMFAVQADGAEVKTIEGMADGAALHPLQQAFWDQHGLQCGFCTPGMIMQAALLERTRNRARRDPRGISGNLCRCTGYVNIVKAIQQASGQLETGRVGAGRSGRDDRSHAGWLKERRDDDGDAPDHSRSRWHGPLGQAQGGSAVHPRQARIHRRRQPARSALARHRPGPYARTPDQVDRRSRLESRSRRRRDRQGPRGLQAPLDADPRRRPADGARSTR